MKTKQEKIWQIFCIVFCVLMVPIIVFNMILSIKGLQNEDKLPTVFGVAPVTVVSGSMAPEFDKNHLIFIKAVDTDTLKEKEDVICFKTEDGSFVTHRIDRIEIVDGVKHFYTKGDANNSVDTDYVLAEQIQGKYVGGVAKLGGVVMFVQSPYGLVLTVILLLLIYIAGELIIENIALKKGNELLAKENVVLTDEKGVLTTENRVLTDEKDLLTKENTILTDEKGLLTKENELLTRANEVLVREKELIAREKELVDKENELLAKENVALGDMKQLYTKGNELLNREKEFLARESESLKAELNRLNSYPPMGFNQGMGCNYAMGGRAMNCNYAMGGNRCVNGNYPMGVNCAMNNYPMGGNCTMGVNYGMGVNQGMNCNYAMGGNQNVNGNCPAGVNCTMNNNPTGNNCGINNNPTVNNCTMGANQATGCNAFSSSDNALFVKANALLTIENAKMKDEVNKLNATFSEEKSLIAKANALLALENARIKEEMEKLQQQRFADKEKVDEVVVKKETVEVAEESVAVSQVQVEEVQEEPTVVVEQQVEEIQEEPAVVVEEQVAVAEDAPIEVTEELPTEEIEQQEEVSEEISDDGYNFGEAKRMPFAEKLINLKPEVVGYFVGVHNELASYDKVHPRLSLKNMSYRRGRKLLSKFSVRGKTLTLHLALPVDEFDKNVFFQKDMGDVKAYEEVPFTVKIKSERGAKNAKKLVLAIADKEGLKKLENFIPEDVLKQLADSVNSGEVYNEQEIVDNGEVNEEVSNDGYNFGEAKRMPFAKKLMNLKPEVVGYFVSVHNELVSYEKVHARLSLKNMSYRYGRKLLSKFSVKGKTLILHLALDVDKFDKNVFFQKDMGDVKAYEEVPFTVKIKSERGAKNAKKLVLAIADKEGLKKLENFIPEDVLKNLAEEEK